MSNLSDFAESTRGFHQKTAVDKLLLIAWFSEARQSRPCFDAMFMRQCFREVGAEAPDMSVYLRRLIEKKPPQIVKEKGGYRLAPAIRRELDKRLGGDPTVAVISQLLADLPAKVPDLAEREFLAEALACYKAKAYRATIVMTWNLAYDHLVRWILADQGRLDSFNQGLVSRFPKKAFTLSKHDDFEELKESEVNDVCRTARLVSKDTYEILAGKLKRRNSVAHPSRVTVTQHQADDAISDLVNNVVLVLT